MVDTNIIKSLGAGSGVDTVNLTKQLTEVERAAPQARIDTKKETAETQISDYGLITSALATLQDSAQTLTDPKGLFSKSASYTNSDALVPVELGTDVQTGSYTFTVEDVATSQSLSSTSFTDTADAVGEGILTFKFGNATVDGSGAMLTTNGFSQDLSAQEVQIEIDSSNNSLEGLRDAINDADFGVQATIVADGANGYVLQMTAESGANNELEITVAESGGSPSNNDNTGLSRFTFNETASQLTQNQGGNDAELTINGLTVLRESNSIDDIVPGLKLDVLKADPGVPVTVTVTDDENFAEQTIRDFVTAYNTFLEAIESAVGVKEVENAEGETEKSQGSLANDPLTRSILSKVRSVISSTIPGLADSNFTALGAIGIRTELDGSMKIDDETFAKAMDNGFEDIQKLFAPNTYTSDNSVYINSYNDSTTAGEYDVVITTQPSRGVFTGTALGGATAFPNFDTTGQDYSFVVEIDGKSSGTLTIPTDTYASQDDLAAAIQSLINTDSNISANGGSVAVTYDSGSNNFVVTSSSYGSSSTVEFTTVSADMQADLGVSVAAGTAGTTVAGTINGVSAFGSGNVLLPPLGQPGEGLALVIGETATSATVNFSRGFAGELDATIEEFIAKGGLIDTREENLEDTLDDLKEDQEALDRRMTAYEERLMNQFIAMESIINGLNSSGTFLENLIETLPFTSGGQ